MKMREFDIDKHARLAAEQVQPMSALNRDDHLKLYAFLLGVELASFVGLVEHYESRIFSNAA